MGIRFSLQAAIQFLRHCPVDIAFTLIDDPRNSGVTESLFLGVQRGVVCGGGGGKIPSTGGGARGRHRNEGCTIKSQMVGGGGGGMRAHGVNGPP